MSTVQSFQDEDNGMKERKERKAILCKIHCQKKKKIAAVKCGKKSPSDIHDYENVTERSPVTETKQTNKQTKKPKHQTKQNNNDKKH